MAVSPAVTTAAMAALSAVIVATIAAVIAVGKATAITAVVTAGETAIAAVIVAGKAAIAAVIAVFGGVISKAGGGRRWMPRIRNRCEYAKISEKSKTISIVLCWLRILHALLVFMHIDYEDVYSCHSQKTIQDLYIWQDRLVAA